MFGNIMMKCSLIAGKPLEPFCYNVDCKIERECFKSKWIGQSAAKFPKALDNTKLMCYNMEKGSTVRSSVRRASARNGSDLNLCKIW